MMTALETAGAGRHSVLNGQYPSSWWAVGFSDEVRQGEVVPVRILERDLILWRGSTGGLHCQGAICPHLGANIGYGGEVVDDTVKCPFHGYRYDSAGAVCERRGEHARAPGRLSLRTYNVQERYGTIFFWNGYDPPDHDIPDFAEIFPDYADLRPDDVTIFHFAFFLPVPAKWFLENIPDANHFSAVHRVCEWGEPEIIEDSATTFRINLRLNNPKPFFSWENIREHARIGQLANPVAAGGDFEMTAYGGGLHLVKLAERVDNSGKMGEFLRFLDSARAIVSWTPVNPDSHLNVYTFLMRRVPVPVIGRAANAALAKIFPVRAWAAILQDTAVMRYRQEQPNPGYGRLDQGLVKFRRFWDGRIIDRSLWAGDNIHSNGARAGIRWDDAPPSGETDARRSIVQALHVKDVVQ